MCRQWWEGWWKRSGLVRTRKKKVALTQRGKDGREEGHVPPTSHGALWWLQASWRWQNPAEHNVENRAASRINVELPLQVGAHRSFHLVDLPECKHALVNDTPRQDTEKEGASEGGVWLAHWGKATQCEALTNGKYLGGMASGVRAAMMVVIWPVLQGGKHASGGSTHWAMSQQGWGCDSGCKGGPEHI